MALAAALAELQAQARCPVCLAPLRDPVTLDCGHNCCAPCLRQRWAGLLDALPCPVCQHHCPARAVPRNPLLAALADLLRPLAPAGDQGARLGEEEEEEEALCARHPRAPALFCEEDLELVCGLCVASAPHRGHRLEPAERAAARHREALKSRLEPLGQQLEVAERGLAQQVCRSRELREQVDARRSELGFELEYLKRFLGREQDTLDIQFLRVMAGVHHNVLGGRTRVAEYGDTLRNLLGTITALCAQPDAELLKGAASVQQEWSRCVGLRVPATYDYALPEVCTMPPQYMGQHCMTSRFQARLTLDPDTAHHGLLISADRKTAVFFSGAMAGPDAAPQPRAFTSHQAVLGTEAFRAGRHFWQVDIRGSGVWSLGVCEESFPRSTPMPPCPSNGCWQFRGPTGPHSDPDAAQIRVGVFLDCDLGEISFYSLSSRTLLCTLSGPFAEELFPYFSAGPSSTPLAMTVVTEER